MMTTLDGLKVVLTRSAEDCAAWSEHVRKAGGTPISVPCLSTEFVCDRSTLARLNEAAAVAEWLALTSPRAACGLQRLACTDAGASAELDELKQRLRGQLSGLKLGVVGPKTRQASAWLGRSPDAEASPAHVLGREIGRKIEGSGIVLFPAAETVAPGLAQGLAKTAVQARLKKVDVYRTLVAPAREPRLDLTPVGTCAIVFASPSAVRGFLNQARIPARARLVSIGPTTTAALEQAGLTVHAEAAAPGWSEVFEAIKTVR